ncbi:MAG: hypothetical protein MI784_04415, partial [Cytophagales bacterium]|nr:hypothetical protein [Cytophagales bacterium]
NLMDYTVQQKTNLLKYQWDHIHDPVAMIGWLQDNEDAANIFNCTWDKLLEYMSFTQTPIEKELEAKKGMFDKVYENYEEYKQKIKENAEGGFKEKEIEKINDWIIRGESAKTKKKYKKTMSLHNVVLEKIIQSKEDSIYYNVWEKGVLLGELEKEGINYPMAIYSMQEKFYIKKLEHTDYCDLIRDETLNKIIKVSDFGDYLLLTFLEGDDIRMVVQLMSNDDEKMEKILKLFGVLKDEEPFELEESESEAVASATVPVSEKVLTDVFSGLSTEKAKEISDAINKYSDKYEIDTPEKMAHFIGQIGVESGGLTALKEKHTYSPRRIVEIFPYANRGHFYEQAVFNETTKTYSYEAVNFDINNCEGTHANKGNADFDYSNATQIVNAYADTLAEVPNEDYKVFANRDDVYWDKGDHNLREKTPSSSYNEGKIRIKSEYINSETMFDVAYACKNGNGSIASQDGSRYKGVGYIHLTGKDNYSIVYNKWKSDNLAERKDITIESFIESMKTDIDVAMEAAMIYWDNNNLNNLITTTDDSEGTVFRNNVRKIGGKVNTGDVDATEAEIGSFSGRLEKSQLIYNEL